MTYDAEKVKLGRQPLTIVELDLDKCSLTYGNTPCTATGTAAESCYNTRSTCQDPSNYTIGTYTFKFCTIGSNFPKGQGFIPCLTGTPQFSSTRFEPEKGIGARGTVSIKFKDFTWPDRDVDPYVDSRTYDPISTGTFWAKFKVRNPYYIGRIMRVKTGFIGDGYDSTNFKTRTYFIEKIDGPDRQGNITIKGKDILLFVDDKAAVVPDFSTGLLTATLTAGGTSFSVTSGEGANYPASNGIVRIGDEIISYTTRTTDTFSGLTRGDYNTTAEEHDAAEVVQECFAFTDQNVVSLIDELLEIYGGIDGDTYIPYDAGLTVPTGTNDSWDDAEDNWLTSFNLTGIISEPTPVKKIIAEIGESCNLGIYWHPVDSEIKLVPNVPPSAVAGALTATSHIVKDSINIKEMPEKRLSRVYLWYGEIDPTEDAKASNFQFLDGDVNTDTESAAKFNRSDIKQIYARFFDSSNAGEAASVAGRLLSRFAETPQEIAFDLDARDEDYEVGDIVSIECDQLPDFTGATGSKQFQIVEAKEVIPGHLYRYKGISSRFLNRYGYIGPNTLSDYDVESAANKSAYGFVGYDALLFGDGELAYSII